MVFFTGPGVYMLASFLIGPLSDKFVSDQQNVAVESNHIIA